MQLENNSRFDSVETVLAVKPNKNFSESNTYAIGIPDWDRAIEQHRNFCAALASCNVNVTVVSSNEGFADSYKISNSAVITDAFAIMGNFPAGSDRQKEMKQIVDILAGKRFLKFVTHPGYMDASDVLKIDNHFYINLSDNTNEEGAAQLAFFLMESDYQVTVLEGIADGASINDLAVYLGDNTVLIDEKIAKHYAFINYNKITVAADERGAANSLMVNGNLLMSAGYSKTAANVKAKGINVVETNISEMEKLGAGIKSLALAMPGIKKFGDISIPSQVLQRRIA